MAVLSTRWSSFSIMMDAVPAAMLFGEISTQSHVRPRISPIHILHAKDGLIASFRWASSQTSSARKIVSASQTSRFWGTALGTVAWRVGFFSISSYFCLFCRISCRVRNARRANNHFCELLMPLFSPSRIKLRLSFAFHLNPSLFR